ncbi:MAG: hypothetical protein PHR35_13400 [Kiritimatiellae bacterium]|nr:hypothetical protein [Kiritimatiellia bacterium]
MIACRRDGPRIVFENGYWQVTHDLDRGGAVVDVAFLKEDGANFLARPLEIRSGAFSNLRLRRQRVSLRKLQDGFLLRVEGVMSALGSAGGPRLAAEYRYTEACVRIVYSLKGANGPVNCCSVAFAPSCAWLEVGKPMFETAWPTRWHRAQDAVPVMKDAPFSWGGFTENGAGVQFTMLDVPAWWQQGSRFVVTSRSGEVRMNSLHTAGGGELRWSVMMAPTSWGRGQACNYREAVICSQPFPSDRELARLKALGVNLIRIHEGANWINDNEDFWMTGVYPPYPGPNLGEMRRVIATCKRLRLAVYPYFCLSEAHPLSDAFLRHSRDWTLKQGPSRYLRWSGPLTDQLWGASMCSASGFGHWTVEHVHRVVREFGFDGMYFDGTGTQLCYNSRHGAVPHTTADGSLGIIERCRRRMPGKFIVLHQACTLTLSVAQLNLGDHLVTFEELGLDNVPTPQDLPITLRIASACISTAIVPGVFCPRDGEPLTPCLYGFSYKPGREPRPSRERLRRGIPAFLLNGNYPYTYYFLEKLLYGYGSHRDRLSDQDGFYALFRKLKAVGDTTGPFTPWYRSPYRANRAAVKTAAIRQAKRTVVIMANMSGKTLKGVRLAGPGLSATRPCTLAPFEYRFLVASAAPDPRC